ncbi:MAG: hypothetical protein HZA77_00560 [Candidatus Schekmanbacteria bacterium]|nr:hypothetical protein [Candidatus Schekmanbacteria bacterium]
MNYLNAVFWDYPEFTDLQKLKKLIAENKNNSIYLWVLKRFLEYGRVIDTLNFFSLEEIAVNLQKLRLSKYAAKKWRRMIEVYGTSLRE